MLWYNLNYDIHHPKALIFNQIFIDADVYQNFLNWCIDSMNNLKRFYWQQSGHFISITKSKNNYAEQHEQE